jgi:hypothetical protein
MFGPGWNAAVEATLRIDPPPRGPHIVDHDKGEVGEGPYVEVDHLKLTVEWKRVETPSQPEPRIVDQSPDPEAARFDLLEKLRSRLGLARSAAMTCALPTSAASALRRSFRRADEDDFVAARYALPGELGAEAGRCAGDQCRRPGVFHISSRA